MADRLEQPEEAAQSFVLRLWQEEPGRWRGRVRHVQSQAQQGFTTLAQATAFVEQQLRSAPRLARVGRDHEVTASSRLLEWLPRSRTQTAAMAAGFLVLCMAALILVDPTVCAPLMGTAVASGITLDEPVIFLAGVAVGGLVVSLLNGSRR